jgi:hypothetical protein
VLHDEATFWGLNSSDLNQSVRYSHGCRGKYHSVSMNEVSDRRSRAHSTGPRTQRISKPPQNETFSSFLHRASFVLALLIVLIHRVTWPLLSTWTYVLTRKEVLEKRKTVRWVAITLVIYGLSGIPKLAFILRLIHEFNK